MAYQLKKLDIILFNHILLIRIDNKFDRRV